MGNVVIPLVIVIVLGVAYIIPRKAVKNDKIANSRIEDRFSSGIKVLDTSARYASPIAQCSSTRIHPQNDSSSYLRNTKKTGSTMKKVSSLRIKNANDIRVIASLKADHAAKNSKRAIKLRVLTAAIVLSILTAFIVLGAYLASVVSIYWVLTSFVTTMVIGGYTRVIVAKDKHEALVEKKKIIALQKKVAISKQSSVKAKTKLSESAKTKSYNAQQTYRKQDSDVSINTGLAISEVDNFQDSSVANATENDIQEVASKWTATRIPTPLYARTETHKVSVAVHEDIVTGDEKTQTYRPTKASPIDNAVSTDELVEKQVRFNLEDVLRSRTAG